MRWFKGKKKAVVATAEFSDSSYGGSDAKLRDSRISEYPSLGDFERKDLVCLSYLHVSANFSFVGYIVEFNNFETTNNRYRDTRQEFAFSVSSLALYLSFSALT